MADEYLYDETLDSDMKVNPMVDKEMLFVQDQNGGAYSGQITFDTAVLSNSGRWLAYSDAYLEIPFVISCKSSVDASTNFNPWMAGLKNGHHQLIDQIQVDYSNVNVIQQQPFLNFFVSYKLMSQFSSDDLKKYGDLIGFSPDTTDSYTYRDAASVDGIGLTNNKVTPPAVRGPANYRTTLSQFNSGFVNRLQSTGFYPIFAAGSPAMTTVGKAQTVAKSYFSSNPAVPADATAVYYWVVLATIRLRDLADFFDKMPLVKGGFLRLIISYNSASFVVSRTDVGGTLTVATPTMTSGRTNPVLVASGDVAQPLDDITAANADLTFRCNIGKTTDIVDPAVPISSCRLYVPAYQLNPLYEKQLLDTRPVRKVDYTDVFSFQITAATGTINSIVTNGIVNPKYVVVVPMQASTSTPGNIPAFQNPFDTAPATTLPLASITNFNCQVGGSNTFQQNFLYDFEAFKNELASINALNGGESTGLTSGLISFKDFQYSSRYYVADISRRMPSEDSTPKSVVILGTINSTVPLDLYVFVVYGRSIEIDMTSGKLMTGSS